MTLSPLDDLAFDTLKLFNLEDKPIESFSVSHQKDGIHVAVRLTCTPHVCPVCSFRTQRIKDYQLKRITHSVLAQCPCFIDYHARRFVCPRCHKIFFENNPFTLPGMRLSLATVYHILNDLKAPQATFTDVAKRYHVSPTTAAAIFDRHVCISRRPLPEYLCIDEVYAFKSYHSQYVCVLLDYASKKIVDLLPSRHKDQLIAYFSYLPRQEREKVKICSFDMWETYRVVCQMMFPKAKMACDKFHVIQELNRKLDQVRLRIMKNRDTTKKRILKIDKKERTRQEALELEEASRHYYVLKKFNWLLFTTNNKILDVNCERRYNSFLKQYMNYDDLLSYLLHIDSELQLAFDLKEQLITFYQKETAETAKSKLEEIIQAAERCPVAEMSSFANTLRKWKNEVIHSFLIVETQTDKNGKIIHKKINNGIIENRNKAIKLLKHSSNGYLNWQRFKNRVLYVLNDDTTYLMYPHQKEEKA